MRRSLKFNERAPATYFNLGFCYRVLGKHAKAREFWKNLDENCEKQKKEEHENANEFWNTWGENALFNLRKPERAIELLKNGAKIIQSGNFFLNCNLAVAHYQLSEDLFDNTTRYFDVIRDAKKYKNKALQLEPDSHEVYKADLLALDKQYREAYQYSSNAVKKAPDSIDICHTHGQILCSLNELEDAKRYLLIALHESNGEPAIRLNLAEVYRRERSYNDSLTELRTVLRKDDNNSDAIKALIALARRLYPDLVTNKINAELI